VVHVDDDTLATGKGTACIENGPAIGAETARRIACDSVIEHVVDGRNGKPVSIGRRSRKIPPYMMRALRKRDAAGRCGPIRGDHWCSRNPTERWCRPDLRR
jgi:hypothetical protein